MTDELPEIPESLKGWTVASVRSVVSTLQYGISTKADTDAKGGIVILRMGNIQNGRLDLSDLKYVPRSKDLDPVLLNRGDVLFNRTNSPDLVGKSAVVDVDDEMVFASYLIRLTARTDAIDPKYLCWWINSTWGRQWAARVKTDGVSQSNINGTKLGEMPIALAPLPEQHRIVEKVEALLEQVNRAKERLDRVPLILKRFRQAVLAAACSGELTSESELDAWEMLTIGSVAWVGTGSTPLRTNSSFYSRNGTPWITSAATALPFVTHAEEFVTDEAINVHRLKKYPIGTLLVAMYGEGKTRGQVSELAIEATINQAMAAIVVDGKRANREFVKLHLQGNYLQMRSLSEGGNQPNLNLSKIKNFPLYLPSLQSQKRIVARVQAFMALADTIERRVQAATARANKLPQAILSKAFSGELVPTEAELARLEGRTYETAEELLKRVTALGSDAPSNRKGRGRRTG